MTYQLTGVGVLSEKQAFNHLLVPQHHHLVPELIKLSLSKQHRPSASGTDERPTPSCHNPRLIPNSVCPFRFEFQVIFFSESKGLPCQLRSPTHVCVGLKSKRNRTKCLHVLRWVESRFHCYSPINFLYLVMFAVASGSIQLTKDYSNFFPLNDHDHDSDESYGCVVDSVAC